MENSPHEPHRLHNNKPDGNKNAHGVDHEENDWGFVASDSFSRPSARNSCQALTLRRYHSCAPRQSAWRLSLDDVKHVIANGQIAVYDGFRRAGFGMSASRTRIPQIAAQAYHSLG